MKHAYHEELFSRFDQNISWKKQIESLSGFLGKACWLIFPHLIEDYLRPQKNIYFQKNTPSNLISLINSLLEKTKRTSRIQKEKEESGKLLYCIPIHRGEQIYAYVILYNVKEIISAKLLQLINEFSCVTIENAQKELEISKLYESIRPKTIALSTVHTIGRIISSTLELDELLPRIARLSLQVMRARRCCIMLVDKYKRNLIPYALVDVKNKNAKQDVLKMGHGVPGKVVKSGNAIFLPKNICVPLVAEENTIGAISIFHRLDKKPFGIFDKEILMTLSEQAVIAIKNAQLYDEQEKLTLNSIKALASILSSGVADNYGRSNLFINITMSIGMELKLRSEQMRMLYYASLLHNVSQMGLPDKILKKSTKLTGKDYKIIQEQHLKGAQLIQPIGGRLKAVLPIIIHHHERYDGKGYPSGLKSAAIPLGARIISIADAFEAMLSKRPYRRKMTISQAVSEIVNQSGEQFDPVIVDAFIRVIKRYKNKIFKAKQVWLWKKF
ncbi:MAG: HD domain-containing protein [Candidatus Omnitrophica bacterium]|nr:HD domain-containing protein [Candidatus Omnitrophota bacterium]